MAALVITATDPDTEWAHTVLDTLARAALHDQHTPNGVPRTPPTAGGRPSLDRLRAEVFFGLLDRAVTDPTFPTQHGKRRIETQVVMATPT